MNKIATIYFYFISAVSLGLIIVGVFYWGNLVMNLTQYEEYPLRYGLEDCDYPYFSPKGPYPVDLPKEATPSTAEREFQKGQCLKQTEYERKQHRLDDIKNAVIFTLVGTVLFLIHYPKARNSSKG